MLNANTLKTLILNKLFATGKFKQTEANDIFAQAVAEAVVEHVQAAAVAKGTCPAGGGALQSGGVE